MRICTIPTQGGTDQFLTDGSVPVDVRDSSQLPRFATYAPVFSSMKLRNPKASVTVQVRYKSLRVWNCCLPIRSFFSVT